MNKALINPKILSWARERTGLSIDDLAKKIDIKDSKKILLWENGEEKPTFLQARKLAKALYIPFGYLYLDKAPNEELPIPDLRTIKDKQHNEFGPEIYNFISEIQLKQDWYRDYLIEQGIEPLEFAGKYSLDTPYKIIAKDITNRLNLTIEDRQKYNKKEFLKIIINKSEEIGIWVMKSGIVGNNTHLPLKVSDFRGFAIYDNIAPIVFLNTRDAVAAQIFTLIHELAHIWIGKSGISNISLETSTKEIHEKTEKLCNDVAAEVLVPEDILKSKWKDLKKIDELISFFHVSGVVIARRAVDLNLLKWEEFLEFYNKEKIKWEKYQQSKQSGGNINNTLPLRYGTHFTKTLLSAAINGQIVLRDAGRFLGIHPSKLFNFGPFKTIGC